MISLRLRMYLLLAVLFGVVYMIVTVIGTSMGMDNFYFYLGVAFVLMAIQYMVGPKLVEWSMHIEYVDRARYPELHEMVEELTRRAGIPKPKIGIAHVGLPNAFAFGRWMSDSRVCVTDGILKLLNKEELRAVLGHELSHVRNRDVLTITVLSVIPMVLYRIAWYFLFWGGGRRRDNSGANTALIGLAALLFYFVTNLLVLYASRIREYFADKGSVSLGNPPERLASALYKLVYGSARMDKEALRDVEGLKAFFLNDPSCASREISELRQIDMDHSGTIDADELDAIRRKTVRLTTGDKLMEFMSTHPNMLKRIKALSGYRNT
ncbi:peptidase [Candidatus Velamenicoccus archaeovorus]|uniref:Protease HtpX homolog n=1 Tax=Velamenicoccus archaeovorus TaxID=1930593 RepID=A0A410P344_VELA1|nr:M48 family metalloprotease [Candidatus Velamenicoccus archaeovorus]QAT16576.1 peptidase [Candidatus Velamenicoccus archaeovorus]